MGRPKGAKNKKGIKEDGTVTASITLPQSYFLRLEGARKGLSRGKYVQTLMDKETPSQPSIVEQ